MLIIPSEHREAVLEDERLFIEESIADDETRYPDMVLEPTYNIEGREELFETVKNNTVKKMDRAIKNKNSIIKRKVLELGEKVFLKKTFDANK